MGENREAEGAFRCCALIFTAILTEDGEITVRLAASGKRAVPLRGK